MGDSRLASPQDNLRSFVKMRGSLEPNEEVVFHWKGILHSYVPEEGLPLQKSQKALLRLEGFDVARFVPVEGGYHMLSRAVILYEEPSSGRNTTTWGAFKQLVDSGTLHSLLPSLRCPAPALAGLVAPRAAVPQRSPAPSHSGDWTETSVIF